MARARRWSASGSWLGPSPARTRRGPISRFAEAGDDLVDPAAADGDGFDHRNAKLFLKLGAVELQSVAAGEVDHVQGDDRRQPEVDQLQREAKVIVEVGGVEHDQQSVGQPLALLLAEQNVAGHRFVEAGRIEPVGAGEIDQLERPPVGQREPAGMPLDRYARIIADLLAGAGQRVEQGALAGIGIADHRDQRNGSHAGISVTRIARAWERRMATVIRPTRTASGSRPNGPR